MSIPTSSTATPQSRSSTWKPHALSAISVLCLLFAGWFGWSQSADATRLAESQATATAPIREIEVGQALPYVGNPAEAEDLQFGRSIDPAEWRRIELIAEKDDGGRSEITLLRPLWWLKQQNAFRGGDVYISVPHCGIDSWARITDISPCPETIQNPDARIVTGTFRHTGNNVIDVWLDGLDEPIGATGNHPFWSEDRQQFVRADRLKVGETLRNSNGTTTVTALTPRPGQHTVYNLEVLVDHVYQVTDGGVLVHNGEACPPDAAWGFAEHIDNFKNRLEGPVERFPFPSLTDPNIQSLEEGLRQAMERSGRNHFNFEGFSQTEYNRWLNNGGPQSTPYPNGPNITNWELHQLNKYHMDKTMFYGGSGSNFVDWPF